MLYNVGDCKSEIWVILGVHHSTYVKLQVQSSLMTVGCAEKMLILNL